MGSPADGRQSDSPPVPNIVRGQSVEDGKVARAKELRREMTPAERLLWARLRRNQLDGLHFRRQQLIHGFIADFYCHAAAVVVEVDGGIHDHQVEADADRDRVFSGIGLVLIRVRNQDVFATPDAVLDRIRNACRQRLGTEAAVANARRPPLPA